MAAIMTVFQGSRLGSRGSIVHQRAFYALTLVARYALMVDGRPRHAGARTELPIELLIEESDDG
jgi:hypothetical protein